MTDDKRNSYVKLKNMLEGLEGRTLSIHQLRQMIAINLGANERTMAQALKTLSLTRLLKDLGNSRFKVK